MSRPAVSVVRGSDEVLRRRALGERVDELLGDADRGLILEDLGDDYELVQLVDASQTLPFLADRRVVVGRALDRFPADELTPLVTYLADPLATTALVLEWTSGRVPKALADALKAAGADTIDTEVSPNAKARSAWFEQQFAAAPVRFDARARQLLDTSLGEDVSRLAGIMSTVAAAYGEGATVTADDLEPYLGQGGGVPPWELTDAIDKGNTSEALDKLRRMMEAGERHPLALLSTLHGHYARMLRLDGSGATSEAEAAAVLGLKGSTFPARKALTQARALGSEGIAKAVSLLAKADLDLRGAQAWPDDLVMEVLVARLAALGRRRAAPAGRR